MSFNLTQKELKSVVQIKSRKQSILSFLKGIFSKKGNGKKELHSTFELVPFKCMEENNLVKTDGTYTAFLKIKTKNINSLSSDEQYRVMHQLELLMRIYDSDLSITSMMFPTNVEENMRIWSKRLLEAKKAKDTPRIRACRAELGRIRWIEINLSNLEFYFQIYGDTKKELNEKKVLIKRLGGTVLGVTDISPKDTEQIVYKLLNMNTKV